MKKKYLIVTSVSFIVLCIIYLPQFFISDINNEYTSSLNIDIKNEYIKYISENGEQDFDNDGLKNSIEIDIGSNPYSPDTDGDGLTDLYEYETKTNVCKFDDTLLDNMEKSLKKEGKTYKNPFQSNGLILWADDLYSRTYGSVVLSQAGTYIAYVFNEFNGYVQFPEGVIPYDISKGHHILLDYDEETNLYIVKSGMKIVTYDKELKYMYKTNFILSTSYKEDNLINKIINAILPSKGLISSCKITKQDTMLDINNGVILSNIPIADKKYDYSILTRFNYNHNTLDDLTDVYRNINNGYSLCVSLIDDNGETLGVIYGYDKYGNLLVADINTGENLGTIYISEHYTKLYIDSNKSIDYNWYSFRGLGYDSTKNARISFYSSSTITAN